MSQITRCPSCATSFKVVPDQLRISEGWVRCGHCEHVFDATEHLQPLPTAAAPAPADAQSNAQDALSAPLAAASATQPESPADPWEIPLPPPPAPPSPEELAPPPPEVLDFAAPAASSIDLDWPEAAPPLPPITAPVPPPPPPPAPIPAPPAPAPIPAASIPTDIDWPEPALELEAEATAEAELARAAEAEANASPVMPELDLAPVLAPLPTPTPEAKEVFSASALAPSLSLDERIEPSGPLDWAQDTPTATALPAAALAATAPTHPVPDTATPATAAAPARKNKNKRPAPAAADTTPPPTADTPDTGPNPGPDEPSFVRAARRKALWRKPLVRLGLALLAMVLLLSLIGQVLVHDRHRLAASQPSWRPMLELLCAPLDCTVGLYRQIGAVVVESSSFNRVDGGVYHFAVTLKNRSGLMLEMPAVELTLTDANEQPVLRRVFMPQELGASTTLAAHAEWSSTVLVRIATSNTPMAGYRVLAFYP